MFCGVTIYWVTSESSIQVESCIMLEGQDVAKLWKLWILHHSKWAGVFRRPWEQIREDRAFYNIHLQGLIWGVGIFHANPRSHSMSLLCDQDLTQKSLPPPVVNGWTLLYHLQWSFIIIDIYKHLGNDDKNSKHNSYCFAWERWSDCFVIGTNEWTGAFFKEKTSGLFCGCSRVVSSVLWGWVSETGLCTIILPLIAMTTKCSNNLNPFILSSVRKSLEFDPRSVVWFNCKGSHHRKFVNKRYTQWIFTFVTVEPVNEPLEPEIFHVILCLLYWAKYKKKRGNVLALSFLEKKSVGGGKG